MAKLAGEMIVSKEHYDLLNYFEQHNKHLRLDREKDKALWQKGHIYESGETNNLFIAYREGYAYGKAVTLHG